MHSKLVVMLAGGMLAIPSGVQAEPFAYVTNAFAPSVSVIDTANNQMLRRSLSRQDRPPLPRRLRRIQEKSM